MLFCASCDDTLITVVYRPPDGKMKSSLDFMEKLLIHVFLSNLKSVIVGDINIDLTSTGCAQSEFLSIMTSYGYDRLINCAIRITPFTETSIDVCFTNVVQRKSASCVLSVSISDHLPLFCIMDYCISGHIHNSMHKLRNINEETINAFKSLVFRMNWADIFSDSNVNSSFSSFYRKVINAYSEAFPTYL